MRTVSNCLDTVRSALRDVDDNQIVQVLHDIECVSRQAMSVMFDVIAEIESRGLAAREGFGSTARLVGAMLRLSAGEARMRTEQARLVGLRRSVIGEPLPAQLPATAAALTEGRIGTGQLRVIAETMTTLPASLPEPVRERAEADLAGYAADFDPRRLRTVAARLLAHLEPDGTAPSDHPAPAVPAHGELWLHPRRDGRLGLEGWLDAEHGAQLRSLIEQLATPRPHPDGTRDTRSVPARQAGALIALAERARAAGDFPTAAGEPPHLTVTLDWEALRREVGTATLDHGQQIAASQLRRLACDAAIIPVLLGGDGEPLDVGRAMRTVPRGIRRALVARDRAAPSPVVTRRRRCAPRITCGTGPTTARHR
jgi:hypothetical protein